MTAWNDLLKWALVAAKSEGQQVGLSAISAATQQLNKEVQKHAPDMAPVLQPLLNQLTQAAVAGVLSKLH